MADLHFSNKETGSQKPSEFCNELDIANIRIANILSEVAHTSIYAQGSHAESEQNKSFRLKSSGEHQTLPPKKRHLASTQGTLQSCSSPIQPCTYRSIPIQPGPNKITLSESSKDELLPQIHIPEALYDPTSATSFNCNGKLQTIAEIMECDDEDILDYNNPSTSTNMFDDICTRNYFENSIMSMNQPCDKQVGVIIGDSHSNHQMEHQKYPQDANQSHTDFSHFTLQNNAREETTSGENCTITNDSKAINKESTLGGRIDDPLSPIKMTNSAILPQATADTEAQTWEIIPNESQIKSRLKITIKRKHVTNDNEYSASNAHHSTESTHYSSIQKKQYNSNLKKDKNLHASAKLSPGVSTGSTKETPVPEEGTHTTTKPPICPEETQLEVLDLSTGRHMDPVRHQSGVESVIHTTGPLTSTEMQSAPTTSPKAVIARNSNEPLARKDTQNTETSSLPHNINTSSVQLSPDPHKSLTLITPQQNILAQPIFCKSSTAFEQGECSSSTLLTSNHLNFHTPSPKVFTLSSQTRQPQIYFPLSIMAKLRALSLMPSMHASPHTKQPNVHSPTLVFSPLKSTVASMSGELDKQSHAPGHFLSQISTSKQKMTPSIPQEKGIQHITRACPGTNIASNNLFVANNKTCREFDASNTQDPNPTPWHNEERKINNTFIGRSIELENTFTTRISSIANEAVSSASSNLCYARPMGWNENGMVGTETLADANEVETQIRLPKIYGQMFLGSQLKKHEISPTYPVSTVTKQVGKIFDPAGKRFGPVGINYKTIETKIKRVGGKINHLNDCQVCRSAVKAATPPSFQCHLCPKTFRSSSGFWSHIKFHKKEFVCHICGQVLTKQINLAAHLTIHTGMRNFKCEICNKGFANKSIMLTHMRTHSNTPRATCFICHKTYKSMTLMQKHMKLIHKFNQCVNHDT